MEKFIKKNDKKIVELDLSKIVGGNTYISGTVGLDGVDCTKTTTRYSTQSDCIGGTTIDTKPDVMTCPDKWGF